jgi:hypothetical protein
LAAIIAITTTRVAGANRIAAAIAITEPQEEIPTCRFLQYGSGEDKEKSIGVHTRHKRAVVN